MFASLGEKELSTYVRVLSMLQYVLYLMVGNVLLLLEKHINLHLD